MRILHTSDWHIGRSFHGHATFDALRGVLEALVAQVAELRVDVVVLAGDVFDSAAPAPACYALLTDTLAAISDAGARIIVTSGNHDSAARLGFQSALLREGITVLTDPAAVGTPVTVSDAHGPVHFYGIPYLEPAIVRHRWEGVELRSQAQTMNHALGLVRADLAARGGRSVAIAHCFAAGVEATPGVEREIRQGGLDVVPLPAFDGPDYVALGHIHGRQQLSERVRYAGAPLHYSFGEADKPRGSWLVELDAAGLTNVEWIPLPVPRRLVTLRGTIAELLEDARFAADEDAWVCAQYTDLTPQIEPMRRLQRRFPFCATVVHTPVGTPAADGLDYSGRVRAARDDAELFDAFLTHVRAGEGATDAERALIRDVVDARTVAEARA
ncbi:MULTISPECIES: exonuclease SbcCD subunit D [Microbacterium]|uniref:Nuclease SbcCD subunit D n=1 Tax=Microbacterium wangchenii TaxID=2541726 RepID=A0ABX5SUP4_9MICO|nr:MULTISPECIES: exonuclease SbcCD subunit D [Microbacterium]MCK6067166.1 exonuclease SbcCD subunit D [Microbacterium sp. EYE_512]QBR89879.1 exonuclease SbcCD subunit D [Microbacterium wangchenii]TXK16524.1 exonuclease SbcCD subunit D [Microbacterium wangchenii]